MILKRFDVVSFQCARLGNRPDRRVSIFGEATIASQPLGGGFFTQSADDFPLPAQPAALLRTKVEELPVFSDVDAEETPIGDEDAGVRWQLFHRYQKLLAGGSKISPGSLLPD